MNKGVSSRLLRPLRVACSEKDDAQSGYREASAVR